MIEAIIPRAQNAVNPPRGRTADNEACSDALLTDGGEDTENTETEEKGDEEESEDTEDTETQVLYLDLEGLFLDLLGLEVDIDQLVLDVTAVQGPQNLLGNLLSTVAGVLDDGLPDLIGGELIELPSLPSGDDLKDRLPSPSLSDAVFGAVNVLLDVILAALEDEDSSEERSDTQQS